MNFAVAGNMSRIAECLWVITRKMGRVDNTKSSFLQGQPQSATSQFEFLAGCVFGQFE
jgi:hypothetical protein